MDRMIGKGCAKQRNDIINTIDNIVKRYVNRLPRHGAILPCYEDGSLNIHLHFVRVPENDPVWCSLYTEAANRHGNDIHAIKPLPERPSVPQHAPSESL